MIRVRQSWSSESQRNLVGSIFQSGNRRIAGYLRKTEVLFYFAFCPEVLSAGLGASGFHGFGLGAASEFTPKSQT